MVDRVVVVVSDSLVQDTPGVIGVDRFVVVQWALAEPEEAQHERGEQDRTVESGLEPETADDEAIEIHGRERPTRPVAGEIGRAGCMSWPLAESILR